MEIIVATRNQGKMREFARILEEFGCTVIGMEEAGVDMEIAPPLGRMPPSRPYPSTR